MSALGFRALGARHGVLFWAALSATCLGVGAITVWLTETLPRQDGGFFYELVLFTALLALSVGTYAVWPSRWNVYAHIQLGFAITAYVVPLFLRDFLGRYSPDTVRSYAAITAIGAAAFVAGLILGRSVYLRSGLAVRLEKRSLFPATFPSRFYTSVVVLSVMALFGLWLSLLVAGVVPIFAADPYAAKYFRAEYEAAYLQVAALFRISFATLTVLTPVLLAIWYATRRQLYLLLALGAIVTMVATLRRTDASTGVLVFLGVVFAFRGRGMVFYLFLVCVAYGLGSALYSLLFGLGLEEFSAIPGLTAPQSFLDQVASNAPDVLDHLTFLSAYLPHPEPTYGRTFFGGMIPGHYKWNPSIWSLSIISPGANVSNLISGGLRLPTPIWGFTAFGWLGAALVPLVSGLIGGIACSWARSQIARESFLQSAMVVIAFFTVGVAAINFVSFLSSTAVAVALVAFLVYMAQPKHDEAAPTV